MAQPSTSTRFAHSPYSFSGPVEYYPTTTFAAATSPTTDSAGATMKSSVSVGSTNPIITPPVGTNPSIGTPGHPLIEATVYTPSTNAELKKRFSDIRAADLNDGRCKPTTTTRPFALKKTFVCASTTSADPAPMTIPSSSAEPTATTTMDAKNDGEEDADTQEPSFSTNPSLPPGEGSRAWSSSISSSSSSSGGSVQALQGVADVEEVAPGDAEEEDEEEDEDDDEEEEEEEESEDEFDEERIDDCGDGGVQMGLDLKPSTVQAPPRPYGSLPPKTGSLNAAHHHHPPRGYPTGYHQPHPTSRILTPIPPAWAAHPTAYYPSVGLPPNPHCYSSDCPNSKIGMMGSSGNGEFIPLMDFPPPPPASSSHSAHAYRRRGPQPSLTQPIHPTAMVGCHHYHHQAPFLSSCALSCAGCCPMCALATAGNNPFAVNSMKPGTPFPMGCPAHPFGSAAPSAVGSIPVADSWCSSSGSQPRFCPLEQAGSCHVQQQPPVPPQRRRRRTARNTLQTTPCIHVAGWKRLRAKRGYGYYVCQECGAKWKTMSMSNRNYRRAEY